MCVCEKSREREKEYFKKITLLIIDERKTKLYLYKYIYFCISHLFEACFFVLRIIHFKSHWPNCPYTHTAILAVAFFVYSVYLLTKIFVIFSGIPFFSFFLHFFRLLCVCSLHIAVSAVWQYRFNIINNDNNHHCHHDFVYTRIIYIILYYIFNPIDVVK